MGREFFKRIVGAPGYDIADGDGSNPGWLHKDTQLTAAQINALIGTNIALTPTPATGLAVVLHQLYMFLDHGGTDFVQAAGTDAFAVKYVGGAEISELGTEAQMTTFIEAAADAILMWTPSDASVPLTAAAVALDNNGATDHTTGDGTLSCRAWYSIVPTAAFS